MMGCACFIVQPNLLEHVAQTAPEAERQAAVETLALDSAIRAHRIHSATLAPRPARAPLHAGAGRPERTIFDARHTDDLHATRVARSEGDPPVPDGAVDQAYDGLGDTYRFYWDVFQRDSIDDSGMPLLGEVHFWRGYDNAFWDGERMVFGDGDGQLFVAGGFTKAIDVIGHELTHGVTQYTLGLRYLGQPGALNESLSDVFGSLVKQYRLGQTVEAADWLIGDGILGPYLRGQALRSMKAPGTAFAGDTQPSSMRDYVYTTADNGGVHTNSGIPNHAFYLAAMEIGGHAWEKAGRIWYETMLTRAVGPDARFHTFAAATVRTAERLFGARSGEAAAVAGAWAAVGVLGKREAAA